MFRGIGLVNLHLHQLASNTQSQRVVYPLEKCSFLGASVEVVIRVKYLGEVKNSKVYNLYLCMVHCNELHFIIFSHLMMMMLMMISIIH